MATNIEGNAYPVNPEADPMSDDIEVEIPEQFTEDNVHYMEDGSVEVGEMEEDEGLPPIEQAPHSANLVAYFDEDELSEMASDLIDAWQNDNDDRQEWHDTYAKGLDLLGMQMDEEVTEPFEGASNVNHPLLAEAVVQFQAQAYKEMLPPGGPVLTKVLGDETPERLSQAARVQDYMNYQIMDRMPEYDPGLDQLLMYLPLGGSAFKKCYYDPIKDRQCSIFIKADHVTVPYSSNSLEDTPRIVHDFMLDGNTILKYIANGFYSDEHAIDIETGDVIAIKTPGDEKMDEIIGITKSENSIGTDEEYLMLEGHLDLDHELLNAEGGIVRPHILTVAKNSGKVLGIRKNWDEADAKEEKKMHFVHYRFLPGLGFYGFGLIHMIGGLTTSVTSILRQLIDSGTFANLPGGLKAKGMRVDGEDTPIGPGEWRDVDVAGGTIRDSLMPLPYKEPSMVLSQLLGVLVQTGQRFASIADMQVGDTSGQQQPVGTTVAMLERGTKVMSAIHKRLHNSQKQEFKIMARVMHENMEEGEQYPYAVQGKDQHVMTADFDGKVDVLPVSDPNIFSMAQRVMLASQQLQMAQAAPQVHDVREAYRRMYAAMGVSDIETILKPEQKPKRVTPMMEHRKLLQNQKLEPVQDMNHQAHLEMHLMMMNHPVVSNNIEFTTNLVQDMMGHIGFLARQQAKAQQPPQQTPQMPGQPPQQQMMPQQPPADITAIELELFKKYLPEMMPPEQEDPLAELQRRQLDITEQYNNGKLGVDEFKAKIAATVDMAKIAADERMAEAINNIKIEDTILNAKLDLRKEAVAGNAPATGNTNNQR